MRRNPNFPLKLAGAIFLRKVTASHVHAAAVSLYPESSTLRSVDIRSALDPLSPTRCAPKCAAPLGSLFWWLSSTSGLRSGNEARFSPSGYCHPEGDQPFLPSGGFYPTEPVRHCCPTLAGLSASTKALLQQLPIRLPLLSNPASPPHSPSPSSVSVPVRTATRMPRVLSDSESVKRFFVQSVAPSFAPYIVGLVVALYYILRLCQRRKFSTCG